MASLLEEFRDKLSSCTDCRACDNVCSFYLATNDDSVGAWSRVKAARAVVTGEKDLGSVLRELYLCTCCGTCEQACPVGVPIPDIVRALRGVAVRRGLAPEPIVKMCRAIAERGSMTGGGREFWSAWIPSGVEFPKEAEALYLVGCVVAFRLHEVARSTVEVLRSGGVDFTVMGEEERCCGLLLFDHGFFEEAKAAAETNLSRIEEMRPNTVLTACAACYWTYRRAYPRIYREPGFKVMHVAEALAELIDEGKLKFKRRVEERMAFFDPCHLTKAFSLYDAPRKVVESIPGIELVELPRSKAEAPCCGAPDGVRLVSKEASLSVAEMIVREALSVGASRIITACPLCMYQLSAIAEKHGLRVTDLPLLVREAL